MIITVELDIDVPQKDIDNIKTYGDAVKYATEYVAIFPCIEDYGTFRIKQPSLSLKIMSSLG